MSSDALDIACGCGFKADKMASPGLQVTGADISEEAIKKYKTFVALCKIR